MDDINSMHVAYGIVSNVKAVPSREITRIEVDIQSDANEKIDPYVAATDLLFGNDALVIPMWDHGGKTIPYGIRQLGMFLGRQAVTTDADETDMRDRRATARQPGEDRGGIQLAFGSVTNVKSIFSGTVTRIDIEIPTNFHKQATRILFRKGALVMPAWEVEGKVIPYGIRPFGLFTGVVTDDPEPMATVSKLPTPVRSVPQERESTPGRAMVQQAGTMCRDNQLFWKFLTHKTGSEIDSVDSAAVALRAVLKIESRKELENNPAVQREWAALLREYNMAQPIGQFAGR